jgi:hypothetical protein
VLSRLWVSQAGWEAGAGLGATDCVLGCWKDGWSRVVTVQQGRAEVAGVMAGIS